MPCLQKSRSIGAIDVAVSTYLLASWLFHAITFEQSSFRENPTYFLTSVRRWACELVLDAIHDWRSEFSHNRQTDRQTHTTTTVTLAAHARRGLITCHTVKVLKGSCMYGNKMTVMKTVKRQTLCCVRSLALALALHLTLSINTSVSHGQSSHIFCFPSVNEMQRNAN